jgi:hypothetical protein
LKSHYLVKTYINPLFTRSYWQMLRDYVGMGKNQQTQFITDRDSLSTFLSTRASHVAQTSLYGYLRTRAGTRFPEMFENPDILKSINIAKWHIWLACVSDLSLFTGQCLYQSGKLDAKVIQQILPAVLQQVLDETGEPNEAGPDFASARDKIKQRVAGCDWTQERDDDSLFSASPEALFYWSPIADELKQRDESIVRNSIRYRWIEVRRSARQMLDCDALLQNEAAPAA